MFPIGAVREIDMIEFAAAALIGGVLERPIVRVFTTDHKRPSLLDTTDQATLPWSDRSYGVEQAMSAAGSEMRCINEDRAL